MKLINSLFNERKCKMKRSKEVFAQMREEEIEIENESTYNYYY